MVLDRQKTLEHAQKLEAKQQFRKAAQQIEGLVDQGSATLADRLRLGELYRRSGEIAKAMLEYLEVGAAYATAGQAYRAIAVYRHMLRLDPGIHSVHLALSRVYRAIALTNDAISQYQETIGVLAVRGRPLDRLRVIRELLELDPDNVRARVRLAEDFAAEGAHEDANAELRKAAAQLDKLGLTEDYIRVAERLTYSCPDDIATSRRLAELYLDAQNAQFALPRLQICYRNNSADAEVLEMLVRAFELLGQQPKMLTVLKELARLHDRNGLMNERNAVLEHIVQLDPGDEWARRALSGRPIDPVTDLGFQELSFDEADEPIPEPTAPREPSNPPSEQLEFESPPAAQPGDAPPPTELDDLSMLVGNLTANLARGGSTASAPLPAPESGASGLVSASTPDLPAVPPPPLMVPTAPVSAPPPPPGVPGVGSAPGPSAPVPPPPTASVIPAPAVTEFEEIGFEELDLSRADPSSRRSTSDVRTVAARGAEPRATAPASAPGVDAEPEPPARVNSPNVRLPPEPSVPFQADPPFEDASPDTIIGPIDLIHALESWRSAQPAGTPQATDARVTAVAAELRKPDSEEPAPTDAPGQDSAWNEFDFGEESMVTDPGLGPSGQVKPEPPDLPLKAARSWPELPADVRATLDEFDFFATQGLGADALQLLSEIPAEYQEHPDVLKRRAGHAPPDAGSSGDGAAGAP